MPGLDTTIHVDMLRTSRRRNGFLGRVYDTVRNIRYRRPIYGLEWGDPETIPPLKFIKEQYVLPRVNPAHVALEIGPGGGRWTRYLLGFKTLYVVDFYPELLKELRRYFNRPNMRFVKNSGSDFPSVPDQSVDFIFSFGCFVHLELPIIQSYVENMKRVLRPGGNVLVQYSDSNKIMSRDNEGFSDNSPEKMRKIIIDSGFHICMEDTTSMWNSSIIQFSV
jgi:SAM-dependent methyltransferase